MLSVDLSQGHRAYQCLHEEGFKAEWLRLVSNCGYATYFQSPEFVIPWYDTYRSEYQPVIARGTDQHGSVVALWFLALDSARQRLVHAGAHQAEYQIWLARSEVERQFLECSLRELDRVVAGRPIVLKYVPSLEHAQRLAAIPSLARRTRVMRHARPLLRLERDEVRASFAKKSNKSRFNRLKRLGALEFKRVRDPAELNRNLPEVLSLYDFRQGAINNSTPFRSDPLKRKFHVALFDNSPSKHHVTLTCLNSHPIAALWGGITGKTVHLGLLAYSPFLAEHSPGKLHIMQLSQMLLDEGAETLDLTPGGDPWKERFANRHDEVAEVVIFPTESAKWRSDQANKSVGKIKRWIVASGISPADVTQRIRSLRGVPLPVVLHKVAAWVCGRREYRVYRGDRKFAEQFRRDNRISENAISDLLSFEACKGSPSYHQFLSDALTRLESGHSVFATTANGRLIHCGWMVGRQRQIPISEVRQALALESNSTALHNFYNHPQDPNETRCTGLLGHMLSAGLADTSIDHFYILTPADDFQTRRVIDDLGFEYRGSLHWQSRFGIESKWADPVFLTDDDVVRDAQT
jgi:CelD/BcsL family acetyltransferase involved in cellulose biosynthesis